METDRLVRKAGKTFTTWRPWLSIKPSANLAGLLALPCRIAEFSCVPPHNEEEKTVDPDELSTTNTKLQNNYFWQMVTCLCHLFFRGFKPALTPSKRFRRLPRQRLLQLHAPAICFSGGSRLPFARPLTPQTLPTLPQASKATTLTAIYTCPCHLFFRTFKTPCHLFFRGFKTAVCPASNPSNASNPPAGLQGNNSYSYMPLPSVFQGVQDCRLPGLKPPKRFQPSRRPPRQQLLQLHAPAIDSPQASKATTLTATCPCHLFFRGFTTSLPGLKPSKRFRRPPRQQLLQLYSYIHAPAICFSGGSRLPFARPQTPQTLPTLTATTCPCHLFFRGFKTAVCPASNLPNASNPPAGLQGNNSYSYMPLPSVFQGVQDCRLPGLKPPKRFQPSRRPPRQQLLQLHAPAIYFSRGSRLPFKATTLTATTCPCHLFFRWFKTAVCPASNPQTLPTLPQASKATTLTATCPCHLFFRGFKTAVCPASNPQTLPTLPQASKATTLTATCPCHRFYFSRGSRLPFAWPQTLQTLPQASKATTLTATYMPLPSVFQGVQARPHTLQTLPQASKATTLTATCPCHLFFRGPGLKPPKRFQPSRRPPRQQLLQLHAPAICFSGGSRLPFARPQTPQTLPTLPQASKATTLTATCPCHLFFRGFKTAVCPASNPPNASNPPAGLQGNNSYSYMPLPSILFFKGFKTAVCLASNPPNASAGFQGNNSYSYIHASAICFSGVQARPHTLQTLPQASKATTLTATCPCHLFFRGFKTAVCPASNPPNASNPSAGLQGNNSYSYIYMQDVQDSLSSVFQGVQDCRLPGLKPPKRFQPSRRPPRQQLTPLPWPRQGRRLGPPEVWNLLCHSHGPHIPATIACLCLRFATLQAPQTRRGSSHDQTFPQAFPRQLSQLHAPDNASNPSTSLSKVTLAATGPIEATLAATRSYRPQTSASNAPRQLPRPNLPAGLSKPTLAATRPRQCFKPFRRPFQGNSRSCRPHRGNSRSYRPQTLLQTSASLSKATLAATDPSHLFLRAFKTAVCPASNPSNPSNPPAGLSNSTLAASHRLQTSACLSKATLAATGPSHLFLRAFKTAICPPSNRYRPQPSVLRAFKTAVCPASNPSNPSNPPGSLSKAILAASHRPPRQLSQLHAPDNASNASAAFPKQLSQLQAPAICF